MPEPVEDEIAAGRRALAEAQAALDGATLRTIDTVTVGWHDTAAHPERGAFAVVSRDGAYADLAGDTLIGEPLRVSARGRSVIVYCVASAAVPTDLSLTRRAWAQLSTLARDTLPCQVEILE